MIRSSRDRNNQQHGDAIIVILLGIPMSPLTMASLCVDGMAALQLCRTTHEANGLFCRGRGGVVIIKPNPVSSKYRYWIAVVAVHRLLRWDGVDLLPIIILLLQLFYSPPFTLLHSCICVHCTFNNHRPLSNTHNYGRPLGTEDDTWPQKIITCTGYSSSCAAPSL